MTLNRTNGSCSSRTRQFMLPQSVTCVLTIVASLLALFSFAPSAMAQTTMGIPPFATLEHHQYETINLSDLGTMFAVPVRNKPGAIPFAFMLQQQKTIMKDPNILVWDLWGNFLSGQMTSRGIPTAHPTTYQDMGLCADGTVSQAQKAWVVVDWAQTQHPMPASFWADTHGCFQFTATASPIDQSGYTVTITAVPPSGVAYTIWDRSGNIMGHGSTSSITDPIGNSVTATTSGSTVTYADTLGTTAMTANLNSNTTGVDTYSYLDANGATQRYTVNWTSYNWRTNFGCHSINGSYPSDNSSNGLTPFPTKITLADNSVMSLTYEQTPGYATSYKTGRLASITLPTGAVISYSYSGGDSGYGLNCVDGTTAIMKRTTPDGTWTYSHTPPSTSGGNSQTTVTDPAGNQTILTFSQLFLLQKMVYQGSQSTGTLLLNEIVSYNGGQSPVAYPITQKRSETHVPGKTQYAYSVTTYDPTYGNTLSTKSYDYSGALLSDKELTYFTPTPCGNGQTFPIHDRVTKSQIKDANGVVAAETDLGYSCTGLTATASDATGQTQFYYGTHGQPTSIYFPTGEQIFYSYLTGQDCNDDLPTSVADTQQSYPSTLSTQYTWDCNGGVITSVTDANQQSTQYTYGDPLWRLTASTDPLGNTTNYNYGVGGVSNGSSLAFGASVVNTVITADSQGRRALKQTIHGPGSGSYDTTSNLYKPASMYNYVSLPCVAALSSGCVAGAPGTFTYYDALGRTTSIKDGGGGIVTLSYNQNDVYKSLSPIPTGEKIKATQSEFDGLGRVSSVCEISSAPDATSCGQSVAQTGYRTSYAYDAASRLVSVTQGQQTRTFTYDIEGRIRSENNPESGLTQYFWDTSPSTPGVPCYPGSQPGRLGKKYDANGNTTCYNYDLHGRLLDMTYSGPNATGGVNRYFVYDTATVNGVAMANAKGQLAEAYTSTCEATCTKITDIGFSYSARGEVTDVWESTPNSGGYYHPTAEYWANGALKNLWISTLPSITYGVDGEGRTSTVSASSGQNPVLNTTYNAASEVTGVTFGSGDSDAFTFDPNTNRMTKYAFKVNGVSETGTLTWNLNGTLASLAIVDPFNSPDSQTCSYLYDDLGRLGTPTGSAAASVSCGSAWSQTISYDRYGNVTKSGSISWQPGYNSSNKYTLAGTSYDANGNLLNDTFHAYTWNVEGRPLTIDTTTLTYDALGRVVEQNISGTPNEVVYTPLGTKLGQFQGSTIQQLYVPLPGGSSAEYLSWGLSHYRHPDWMGSNRLESSSNTTTHQILDNNAYAPFGEPYVQTGNGEISFTGQNKDTDWLQYDFLARQYDPKQGRWISPDPLSVGAVDPGDPQSWNAYAYAGNNPLVFSDPDGRDFGDFDSLDSLAFDINLPVAPIIGDDSFTTGICVPNPCSATDGATLGGGLSTAEQMTEAGSVGYWMDEWDNMQSGLAQMGSGHGGSGSGWSTVQNTLDLAGMIPGPIGTIANFSSAGISLYEGHYGQAALSLAFAIPVVGSVAEFGRAAEVAEEGFSSFRTFKRAYGAAEEGNQWHHIVEQGGQNIERFGAEAIHSPSNLLQIPKDAHIGKDGVSAYYSSKDTFTNGMTVRQWLATKSFEEQREFGVKVLKDKGIIP